MRPAGRGVWYPGLVLGLSLLITACAAAPVPPELVSARQAFQRINTQRTGLVPAAELEIARQSLERAEQAFADEPEDAATRDLAYLALRQAEQVQARAVIRQRRAELRRLQAEKVQRQARIQQAQRAMVQAQAAETARREAERMQALQAARARVQRAVAELRSLGTLHEAESGLRVRIPTRQLFITPPGRELAASAQVILPRLAAALKKLEGARFVVEAFTDSVGIDESNRRLSLKQAEEVRSRLLAAGLPPERVSVAGRGEEDPVSSNASVEARRQNRRIEIVVEPPAGAAGEQDIYSGLLAP